MKYVIIILSLILISCQQNVRVENEIIDEDQLLVNLAGSELRVQNIGKTSADVYDFDILSSAKSSTFNIDPSGTITKIIEEDNELYLIEKSLNRFIAIDARDYSLINQYELSDFGIPIDLVFPNTSNGYFTVEGKDSLFIVDIKSQQLVRNLAIKVGENPTVLNVIGNEIYVANQGENSISIVRTNTKEAIAKVDLPGPPVLIENYNIDGDKLLVICHDEVSDPQVVFIDLDSRSVISTININDESKTEAIIPICLAITDNTSDFAYLGTNLGTYQIDVRNRDNYRYASTREEYIFDIFYDQSENDLIYLTELNDRRFLRTASPVSFQLKTNVLFPPNASFFFPHN